MATISQFCISLAAAAHISEDHARRYARALLNAGELPKAVGRTVPEIDWRGRAKLLLAAAVSDRPQDCVRPMRQRFEAKARFGETKLNAGDMLASQLEEFHKDPARAFAKWSHSSIGVSRSGIASVHFQINENVRAIPASGAHHVEFLNWPDDEAADGTEPEGFEVFALIHGRAIMRAAFDSDAEMLGKMTAAKAFLEQAETEAAPKRTGTRRSLQKKK